MCFDESIGNYIYIYIYKELIPSQTDADFINVIHTNGEEAIAMAMGLLKPLGHVDFYPNGGGLQPGCFIDPIAFRESKENYVSTLGGDRSFKHSLFT